MLEKIYNLFLHIENNMICRIGSVEHETDGTDEEKIKYLQSVVHEDSEKQILHNLPERFQVHYDDGRILYNRIRYTSYQELEKYGQGYQLFSEVLVYNDSVRNPLVSITPFVNGRISIEGQEKIFVDNKNPSKVIINTPDTYYEKYSDSDSFDAGQMITDDFFTPIKLLIEEKHFISASKLLLSSIDSFSFLDLGDIPGNFKKWINKYMNKDTLCVTENELWELRNSLLHMTNYDSRAVLKGDIKRINLYWSYGSLQMPKELSDGKSLSLNELFQETANAVEKWLHDLFNERVNELEMFFKRYDLIISDARNSGIFLQMDEEYI